MYNIRHTSLCMHLHFWFMFKARKAMDTPNMEPRLPFLCISPDFWITCHVFPLQKASHQWTTGNCLHTFWLHWLCSTMSANRKSQGVPDDYFLFWGSASTVCYLQGVQYDSLMTRGQSVWVLEPLWGSCFYYEPRSRQTGLYLTSTRPLIRADKLLWCPITPWYKAGVWLWPVSHMEHSKFRLPALKP